MLWGYLPEVSSPLTVNEAFPRSWAEGCLEWWLTPWILVQATLWLQIPATPVQVIKPLLAMASLSMK